METQTLEGEMDIKIKSYTQGQDVEKNEYIFEVRYEHDTPVDMLRALHMGLNIEEECVERINRAMAMLR